ncbi:F0F1 ATP synthase subunit B family protein [Roseovarius sp. ZX-A-9]|uniref:F0F1 ATP synthase subunit B family protein n=1 Tax=Roseovarius sp. ZX-A-9 TaxID=3014783 RepID=UPI00232D8221|nr:F0F1 ATP synthase subunit B [Roseovarius sp. ZX-A-9]
MSIDWITVAAQIANFLVLVWLLRRFLYRPILDGIDAREAEIAKRMQAAVTAKEQAEAAQTEYQNKVQALHVAQSEMTETIRKKAEEQRDALLAAAREKMDAEHSAWQAHLDAKARDYAAKLHGAGAAALLSLTRKALGDLADESLEARMAHHLVQQIKPMAKDLIGAAGQAAGAVITSHSPLPPATQDALTAELRTIMPDVSLRFEVDAQQAPGLVLRLGGAQVEWTTDSYIDGLDAMIIDQLTKNSDTKVHSHGD